MGTYNAIPQTELQVREWLAFHLSEFAYSIQESRTDFPDLILRLSDGALVRAEVELESENFVAHKHDVTGCDLVICWRHTMRLAVPVLELSTRKVYAPMECDVPVIQRPEKVPTLAQRLGRYLPKCQAEYVTFLDAVATDCDVWSKCLDMMTQPRLALFSAQVALEAAIRRAGGVAVLENIGRVHPHDLFHLLVECNNGKVTRHGEARELQGQQGEGEGTA